MFNQMEDGNGWWFIIVLFALIFGWGNNGFMGGNGANSNYVLSSDFASLQRQIDNSTDRLAQQTNQIANGLCDGFYTQAQLVNGVNQNISNTSFGIQSAINGLGTQMQECCCQNRYDALSNTNAIQSALCQTNYNAQNNTRDIVDSQNAGTQAILQKLSAMESNAKDDKIAELTAINSDLRLRASQQEQNAYIQSLVKPPINPSYVVANPYCSCGNATPYYYGTTIA